MSDVDFILQIIAKLRDEASPGLARLKAELNSFKDTQDAENAEKNLGKAIDDTGRKADESKRKHEGRRSEIEKSRRASEEASRGAKDLGKSVEEEARAHDKASESVRGHNRTQEEFAEHLRKIKEESRDTGKEAESLEVRMSKLRSSWSNFDKEIRDGALSKDQARRGIKEYVSEYNNLSRQIERGSEDWRRWSDDIDNISKRLKNLDSSGGFLKSLKSRDVEGVIESLDSKIGDLGIRITGVASFFTGLFELIKIGFSQQIITGVLSLAGGLFSLASAATQAGAALAGAFVSGLGQAIPMLSIVAASVERFKTILQAVSVAGQAEQQQFFNPAEKQILQLQQTNQLISANQQLSNSYIQLFEAQQRVRDSQIALTEARYNAQRQITELALAEKNARLQAEGATVSLTESKRQLQIAIQKGDVAGLRQAELAVKEAELNKKKADFEIPRSEREARLARERGVSGAPTVISAVRGLEGSRLAVMQAQQGAAAAQRQKQIIELQRQARSSKETQFESQLKFLEKSMSPTELGLTNALIGIEKELKSPNSPLKKITDYIVEPFAKGVSRIRSILKDSSFLKPVDELAKSMGGGLNRLEQTIFGSRGTSFFEAMAKDAKNNIPIVTSSIEHIMHLFEDIAQAAAPAFHKLSEDWDNFWGKLDTKYEGKGLEKLEKFFNKSVEYAEDFGKLGTAVFNLFKALGSDAAPQGLLTVTSFTGAIKDATNWVEGHKSSVTNFFKEAREGLGLIASTLFQIGKQMLEVFNLDSLRALSAFINQVVLPGLRLIITILGKATTVILDFFNLLGKPGRDFLGIIGAIIFTIIGITKIYEPLEKSIMLIKGLRGAIIALKAGEGIVGAWNALAGAFDRTGKAAAGAKTEIEGLTGAETASAGAAEADAAAQTGTAAGEGAAGAAGGGGLLARLGAVAGGTALRTAGVTIGGIALAGQLTKGLGQTNFQGLPTTGNFLDRAGRSFHRELESLNPFSGSFLSGSGSSENKSMEGLRKFGTEVEKLKGKLSSLPKSKLEEITSEARILANDPSLEKYKGSLEKVIETYSPMEKANRKWALTLQNNMEKLLPSIKDIATTFEGISADTGRIWTNIKNVSKENIESIRENLGLSSKQGKEALAANFGDAELKIEESMRKGGMTTQIGMERIKKLVSQALDKYGVKPSEINSSLTGTGHTTELRTNSAGGIFETRRPGTPAPIGHASGAYVPATPGGQRAVIGEGGHDEVVLSTDPRYAQRSRKLLGQYFSRAPHMASGGFIADPGTNFSVGQEPKIVTELQKLGEYMHTTIYGISGYRSPRHSVEVGGFANDPHTRGEAADIGVGSNTLASAARLTAGLLARFDLYRPFYPASAHEINHVQLLPGTVSGIRGSSAQIGGSVSGAAAERHIQEIIAPRIRGGGAVGEISQGALNIATKAANIYLSKFSSPIGQVLGNIHLTGNSVGKKVMNFFAPLMGRIAAAGLIGNFEQESSLNPNAPGGGLDQGQGSRDFSSRPLSGQLAGIWSELTGSERGTLSALRRAKSAAEAARIFSERFERPGIPMLANRERYAEEALRSFAVGGIAPWGGRPVPIIAHEGERIMNPAQYHETARLAGITPRGLDRHLGYDGSPRQSFAAGGPIERMSHPQRITEGLIETNLIEQFTNIVFEIGNIGNVLKSFNKVKKAFSKLKKSSGDNFVKNLEKVINEIIIETNGVLARLQEGREFFKARLEKRSVEKDYVKKGSKIALAPRGEVGIAEASEKNLVEESRFLQEESKIISKTIAETKKLKHSNARTQALKALAQKQKELGETIDQNIEARYQAETQVIQARITEANNQYQITSQEQQTRLSKAQGLGNLSEVGQIEEQTAASAQAQIGNLTVLLQEAKKIGNKELESSLRQEIISLQQTINSTVVERISNAQNLIQRESAQAESKSGTRLAFSKILQAEQKYEAAGREEKAGLTEKQANLLSVRAQEEALREQAIREGDTAAVISLGEELNKNSVEIAENNLALRENAVITRELMISQIEATGQFKSGIYSAAQQGLEILGKTTGFTNVTGLIAAAKGREGAYEVERAGLEKEAGGIGLGVEGMSPSEILTYLASPAGMAKIKQLESGEDKAEQEQMYKLIQALEANSINTLKNAEEIAKLNGQLNQPQSWSTAAFNAFRTSFFTGMGGLLEPYSSALPPGSRPEGLPKYGSGSPGMATAKTHIENLNLTHPVEVLDPSLLGEELSYHISTTPPTF